MQRRCDSRKEVDTVSLASQAPESGEIDSAVDTITNPWVDNGVVLHELLQYMDDDQLKRHVALEQAWGRQQMRANTKISYQFLKFQLFMDDIEGCARMLSVLDHEKSKENARREETTIERIICGFFQLDPHRSWDLFFASPGDAVGAGYNKICSDTAKLHEYSRSLLGFRITRCSSFKHITKLRKVMKIASKCSQRVDIGSFYPYLLPEDGLVHERMKGLIADEWTSGERAGGLKMEFIESISSSNCFHVLELPLQRLLKLGMTTYATPNLRSHIHAWLSEKLSSDASIHDEQVGEIMRGVLFLGPSVCCDASLAVSILHFVRLLCRVSNVDLIEMVMSTCFLPGLVLTRANPMVSMSLWDVLGRLSYSKRSKIYNHVVANYDGGARIDAAHTFAFRAVQRLLRRLSKQNVKDLGRKLGKLSLSHPFIVSSAILQQIQVYTNMICPIVDALKYCNALTLDILNFSLIKLFSGTKPKLKEDGQNVSLWFSALCTFSGLLHERYHCIELSRLLQYILKSLNAGQVLNLFILKEIISKMARVDILKDVSLAEIHRSAAGEKLRRVLDRTLSSGRRVKGISRLRMALENSHTGCMTIPLLLAVAKCRQQLVRNSASSQPKFIGQLFDEVHIVLLQYVSFIQQAYTTGEYRKALPDIETLMVAHKLEPSIVFHLQRPILQRSISNLMQLANGHTEDRDSEAWEKTLAALNNAFPASTWEVVSPELFLAFWTFDLQSVFVPDELYTKTGEMHANGACKALSTICVKPTDNSQEDTFDLEREREDLRQHCLNVKNYLSRNSKNWVFAGNSDCVQNLMFSRSKVSHADALYSAYFLQLIVEQNVTSFSILQYSDRLFLHTAQLISSCSELESKFFATFVASRYQELFRWRSETVFKQECWPRIGFQSCLNDKSCEDSYNDFLKLLFKWERRLTKGVLRNLNTSAYMEVANAFSVLITVVDTFPITKRLGEYIHREVKRIKNEELRGDIATISTRYLSLLQAKRSKWLSVPDSNCVELARLQ